MNLGTRLALAFASVGAAVAGLVGVLSYDVASDRITDEIDRTLTSVTTAVVAGQNQVLATPLGVGPDGVGGDGVGGNGRARPGGGAEVGFTVDAARLLPDSEPDHVRDSPGSVTVDGT